MARYYVEKDGEWNIFSTIIDDFLFDEFICLDALKARLLYERFKELTEDMDSLLTDNPRVNVMAYSEAIERRRVDTPQTEQKEYPVGCSGDWSVNCTSCDRYFSCDYLSGKQTESTGSPIGDYRDGVGAWQTDCEDRYAIRTDSGEVVAYACPLGCEQTDCPWE